MHLSSVYARIVQQQVSLHARPSCDCRPLSVGNKTSSLRFLISEQSSHVWAFEQFTRDIGLCGTQPAPAGARALILHSCDWQCLSQTTSSLHRLDWTPRLAPKLDGPQCPFMCKLRRGNMHILRELHTQGLLCISCVTVWYEARAFLLRVSILLWGWS